MLSLYTSVFFIGEHNEGAKNIWQKKRVDRMLVDHLLRSGHYTASRKLAESSGIEVSKIS